MTNELKVGDTVSYQDLTGKIVSIFDSPSGAVLEIACEAKSPDELDVVLWLPESELT